MNQIVIRKRNIGRTLAFSIQAAEEIKSGLSVCIMSMEENGYAERVAKMIKEYSVIEVEIERLTSLRPINNICFVYDDFGEIIGSCSVPQIKVFIGCELKAKKSSAAQ